MVKQNTEHVKAIASLFFISVSIKFATPYGLRGIKGVVSAVESLEQGQTSQMLMPDKTLHRVLQYVYSPVYLSLLKHHLVVARGCSQLVLQMTELQDCKPIC